MHNRNIPATILLAIGATLAALLCGMAIGWNYWSWAFVFWAAAVGLLIYIWQRNKAIRKALAQLQAAALEWPAGRVPGLSDSPSSEIAQLAGAMDEMTSKVQEQLARLEEEQSRLRAVFTSMRDAVITLGASGRIALINPAAERLFEVKATDVVGKGVLQVIRHEQLALALHEKLTNTQASTMEFESFDVPHRHFQAELAPVLSAQGEPAGAVAVLHDITQLRRLEQMRSQFVANVSHELRTPITSIKGFLETLLDGAMDDTETCRHFLTIISQEANRLANLVSDLLDLSQLEAETAPIKLETVNLLTEAAGALELMQPMADARKISTELRIPADLQARANSAMLRQSLLNMLDNAIKYSPAGAKVWVEAAPTPNGKQVVVSVCDTGPGIPSSRLELLFERFYRVDKARSRNVGGTGLGLAIVKHIAERHGGKAWAESTLGKGSRFSLTLPAENPPPPPRNI